jgi:CRP-like cAMP-binding protein
VDTGHLARILARCQLFRSLAPDDLLSLAKQAECRKFSPGVDICHEAAQPAGLHVLVSGNVRLVHARPDGTFQIVGVRRPVWALELSAVLDGGPFLTTCQATVASVTVWLPRAVFMSVLSAYPEARSKALEQLASELRERDITATTALWGPARERIACALLRLERQFGEPGPAGQVIRQRLTRQDIASITGVALETGIRIMSALEREGWIETHAQQITITDKEALRAVSGCDGCLLQCSVYERGPIAAPSLNGAGPVPARAN